MDTGKTSGLWTISPSPKPPPFWDKDCDVKLWKISFQRLSYEVTKGQALGDVTFFTALYLCAGQVSNPRRAVVILPIFVPLPPNQKLFNVAADFLKQGKICFPFPGFFTVIISKLTCFKRLFPSLPITTAKAFLLSNSSAKNKNSFRFFICKASTS